MVIIIPPNRKCYSALQHENIHADPSIEEKYDDTFNFWDEVLNKRIK
jgi:hypothetical protein